MNGERPPTWAPVAPEEVAQMFARIFAVSSNAMAFTEAGSGRIVEVNATWLRDTGLVREEVVGRTALGLGLWPDSAMREVCLAAFRPDGRLVDHEMTLLLRGHLRTVIASAEPVRLPSGGYVLWEFRDIADRKRAELALQESERKFRAIFDQSYQFVGLLDAAGRVLEANDTALRFAGVGLADVVGRPLWETPWWSHSTTLQEQLRAAIARAAAGEFVRFPATHPGADGRMHHVDFSLKPVRGGDGQVSLLIPEGRDVTLLHELEAERQLLHERMQQAQKLESLGILAGGIAHDFNNLLTVVLGNSSLVAMELPPGSAAWPLIDGVQKAARRAAELAQQMLAYSGRGSLQSAPVRLDRVADETRSLLASTLGRHLRLHLELAEAPVVGDETQLRQVVMNLLLNAADSLAGRDGVVALRSGVREMQPAALRSSYLRDELPAGRYAFFEVQDSGCGMDEATLRRIFEPFFTTKPKGRGLGLSAVLGIVKGHRGTVQVESRPGAGTRFVVLLPEGHGAGPGAEATVGGDRKGARLLIVDDEERVLTFVARALERAGFRTLRARDGHEGLEVFARERAALDGIVLDLAMPQLGGAEMLERIRAVAPELPVLVTSGYSPKDAAARCANLGSGFLQKPFDARRLVESVQELLRRAGRPAP